MWQRLTRRDNSSTVTLDDTAALKAHGNALAANPKKLDLKVYCENDNFIRDSDSMDLDLPHDANLHLDSLKVNSRIRWYKEPFRGRSKAQQQESHAKAFAMFEMDITRVSHLLVGPGAILTITKRRHYGMTAYIRKGAS